LEGGDDVTDHGEGATPAMIHNHAFAPDGDWWTTCRQCGLAEAAHLSTTRSLAKSEASSWWGASPSVVRAMREAGDR
jgi:hypothetical protein